MVHFWITFSHVFPVAHQLYFAYCRNQGPEVYVLLCPGKYLSHIYCVRLLLWCFHLSKILQISSVNTHTIKAVIIHTIKVARRSGRGKLLYGVGVWTWGLKIPRMSECHFLREMECHFCYLHTDLKYLWVTNRSMHKSSVKSHNSKYLPFGK